LNVCSDKFTFQYISEQTKLFNEYVTLLEKLKRECLLSQQQIGRCNIINNHNAYIAKFSSLFITILDDLKTRHQNKLELERKLLIAYMNGKNNNKSKLSKDSVELINAISLAKTIAECPYCTFILCTTLDVACAKHANLYKYIYSVINKDDKPL
jgi:hypothetical protein